ncbi:NAD(P)/FAD-dependent oxidoreductase [Streptomyces rubiginosohelvolus]|uniref:NAD(P)/FAD-dependent oxidoreductase n=1 Tax=Streptomyces rubiginosohelvolus TaxID=67362 RepID=UPI003827BEA8
MTPSRCPGRRYAPRFGHAAVIGAGIAGLLAARVLGDTFERVTLIERDVLPDQPKPRPGVPQDRHAHALQAGGLLAFERLLPGISEELSGAGVHPMDMCRTGRVRYPSGEPPPMDSDVVIQPVSRPLLEAVVRGQVLRAPGVTIVQGRTVTGLTVGNGGRRVTGLRLRDRSAGRDAVPEAVLPADLIVDASGRSSHLRDWLAELGLPQPGVTTVDAHVGYATRVYRTTPGTAPPWRGYFETPLPPSTPRGAFALHIENDRLLVTLQGAAGDHPGNLDEDFDRYLRSLRGELWETVKQLEPVGRAVRYARNANRRVLCHRTSSWPERLIAVGDAVCAFNPVYAQGMTTAALEAELLRQLLDGRYELDGLARTFQWRLARITLWPWLSTTLADRAWEKGPTPLPSRTVLLYLRRWQWLAQRHPRMHLDLLKVTNMLVGPLILLHPRHLARMLVPRSHQEGQDPEEPSGAERS